MELVKLQTTDGKTIPAELRQVEFGVSATVIYRDFETARIRAADLEWSPENKIFEGTIDGTSVTLDAKYNEAVVIERVEHIYRASSKRA